MAKFFKSILDTDIEMLKKHSKHRLNIIRILILTSGNLSVQRHLFSDIIHTNVYNVCASVRINLRTQFS